MIAPADRWRTHLLRLLVGAIILGVPALALTPAFLGARRTNCYFVRDRLHFVETENGLEFLESEGTWHQDAGEFALPIETPFYAANAWIRWRKAYLGVVCSFNHTLAIDSPSGTGDPATLTPIEVEQVYIRYAAYLKHIGIEPATAGLFLKGPGVTTRIDWLRVLALVLWSGVGLGAIYAVGWFVNAGLAESFRNSPSKFDPETGRYIRCPNCKYDLKGLSSDICPECGRINPRRAGSSSPSL